MKKLDFRTLSNKRCTHPGCRKYIKQNVINRQPNAKLCYTHYMEQYRKEQNSKS